MVISDFNMPVLDGLNFLKALRCGMEGIRNDTPVLMLTGTAHSLLVQQALALDVDGFLLKPVSQASLHSHMRKAMDKNRKIKPPEAYASVAVDPATLRLLGYGPPIDVTAPPSERQAPLTPEGSQQLSLATVPVRSVLAVSIRAKTGELLVAAGMELSERLIHRLQELSTIGIAPTHVWVF